MKKNRFLVKEFCFSSFSWGQHPATLTKVPATGSPAFTLEANDSGICKVKPRPLCGINICHAVHVTHAELALGDAEVLPIQGVGQAAKLRNRAGLVQAFLGQVIQLKVMSTLKAPFVTGMTWPPSTP